MKIKLDENLPLALQAALAGLGHDVHSVFDEHLAGEPDKRIRRACLEEERFLVTQDLDFSDARKYPPRTHAGIMILRLADDSRENLIRMFFMPSCSTTLPISSVRLWLSVARRHPPGRWPQRAAARITTLPATRTVEANDPAAQNHRGSPRYRGSLEIV